MREAILLIRSVVLSLGVLAAVVLLARRHYELRRRRTEFDWVLSRIGADPLNHQLHLEFLHRFGDDLQRRNLPLAAAYQKALDILAAHPKSFDARVFALAVGKVY